MSTSSSELKDWGGLNMYGGKIIGINCEKNATTRKEEKEVQEMAAAEVREEDAEVRIEWRLKIRCGYSWREKPKEEEWSNQDKLHVDNNDVYLTHWWP